MSEKIKKFKKYFFILIAVLIFIAVLFIFTSKTFQNDTFYSIKIGNDIFTYGIDMIDHYSFIGGLPYTYPHYLFDIMVAISYNIGGYFGVYLFTICLYLILGVSLFYLLSKLSKHKIISFVLSILVLMALSPYVAARAQLLSYTLIIWFYYGLEKYFTTQNKKYLIIMFITSVLIANTHVAVWPFLFILFLPYMAELLINNLNLRMKGKKYKDRFLLFVQDFIGNMNLSDKKMSFIKLLGIPLIITILTGFITPLGLVPFTYLPNTIMGVSQSYISEHSPIVLYHYIYLIVYIVLLLIIIHNKKLKVRDIFMLLGLSFMMLSSSRHASLFLIISLLMLGNYLDNDDRVVKAESYIYRVLSSVIVCSVFIFAICIASIEYDVVGEKIKEPYISDYYPIEATKWIKDNLDYKDMHLYNYYDIGSYLLLNDIKVMFDSRADLYTKEFNHRDDDLFVKFMTIKDNYKEVFEEFGVDYALILKEKQEVLNLYLMNDNDFSNIYEDSNYIIYKNNK